MSEIKLKLTGGKAVLAIIAIVGIIGFRYVTQRTTLATEAADQLRFWLAAEYMRAGLPDLEQAMQRGDVAAVQDQAQELIARERIAFPSIRARGKDDDIVVRVEIQVDGRDPPVGRPVRYFRMEHSMVTGWRVRRETTSLAYHLKLL